MLTEISKNIKIRLVELNMTATDLSEKSGVTNSYLSNLFTGKNTDIKYSTLNKIAKTLDVKVCELLKED